MREPVTVISSGCCAAGSCAYTVCIPIVGIASAAATALASCLRFRDTGLFGARATPRRSMVGMIMIPQLVILDQKVAPPSSFFAMRAQTSGVWILATPIGAVVVLPVSAQGLFSRVKRRGDTFSTRPRQERLMIAS